MKMQMQIMAREINTQPTIITVFCNGIAAFTDTQLTHKSKEDTAKPRCLIKCNINSNFGFSFCFCFRFFFFCCFCCRAIYAKCNRRRLCVCSLRKTGYWAGFNGFVSLFYHANVCRLMRCWSIKLIKIMNGNNLLFRPWLHSNFKLVTFSFLRRFTEQISIQTHCRCRRLRQNW